MFRLYVYYKGFYTATNTSEWIWPSIRIAKINPQIFITIVGSHDLHHHHHNDNHYHHQQRSLVPFQSVTGFSIQFLFWQSLISTTTKPCSISICVWFFYSTLIPTKRYFSSIQMKLVSLKLIWNIGFIDVYLAAHHFSYFLMPLFWVPLFLIMVKASEDECSLSVRPHLINLSLSWSFVLWFCFPLIRLL